MCNKWLVNTILYIPHKYIIDCFNLPTFLFKFVRMGVTKSDNPKNLSGNYIKLKMIKYR